MKILVTGGAGYIGSHFVKRLADTNYTPIVIDNLSRGHIESVPSGILFKQIDLLDEDQLYKFLSEHKPDAVVHFAAFAYVGESVEQPDLYYQNNVAGSLNLIKICSKLGINKFVFSSTCSVYGNPTKIPISEDQQPNPINPYANTKLMIEKILQDHEAAYGMKYVALRYFNAAGADDSGLIGESHDPEPHLIPLVIQTALGKRNKVSVYGNDYNTMDGTCIRDYIHVNDLAEAHLQALNHLEKNGRSEIINLGTGNGNSVLEIIRTVEEITQKPIHYDVVQKREGDPAVLVADNKKALKVLGWSPKYTITDIIKTAYQWHADPKY